jgi:hypothetical protein
MFRPMAHHPHDMAHGLASLGRGGDSTLVHMSPAEVGGLQKLAMAHGGSLTRNPHTGLPEAGFLSSILPMIGGALTAVFAPELLPEEAAATGLIAKASGETWKQSIMAGLSAYGAGSAASSIGNFATAAVPTQITSEVPTLAGDLATDTGGAFNLPAGFDAAGNSIGSVSPMELGSSASGIPGVTEGIGAAGMPPPVESGVLANPLANAPMTQTLSQEGATIPGQSGLAGFGKQMMQHPLDTTKQFYQGLGAHPMMATAGLAGGIGNTLQSLQNTGNIPGVTNQNEYYVQAPGGKPLYTPGTVNPNIAKLGYLPAGQEAMIGQGFNPGVWTTTSPIQAQTATAGSPVMTGTGVAGAKEGGLMSLKKRHFDAGGPTVSSTTGNQMLAAAQANYPGPAAVAPSAQSEALSNMNNYFANQLQNPSSMLPPTPSPDAMNSYLANINQMVTPPTVTGGAATPEPSTSPVNATPADYAPNTPSISTLWQPPNMGYGRFGNGGGYGMYNAGVDYTPSSLIDAAANANNPTYAPVGGYGSFGDGSDFGAGGKAHGGVINRMAHGGLADLTPTYAAGGKLLRGDGDGMSDSIPAVIHGSKPQRAALADGEFVIPADVVSHLGNGSTEAGSRKLYAMMDKVRYARTGNKKQGKQINPDKFMP